MTIRAFIAVELDDDLRREIARVQENIRVALEPSHVAWVRPASMHLTLKFLGDVDEAIVPVLHTSIATAIHNCVPIGIPLARLGAFPRLKEPRNLWLGPDDRWAQREDAMRLQLLVQAIDECCAVLGAEREVRPFSPHLTLGRVKSGERQIGRLLASQPTATQRLQLPPLVVSHVTFFRSQLESKGAIHTPLWTASVAM